MTNKSDLNSILSRKRWAQVARSFLTNSALFPFFNLIRVVSTAGLISYISDPPSYFSFLAAIVQSFLIGTRNLRGWQFLFANLVGPFLYTVADFIWEGWEFFHEPYHWVYWGFGLAMGVFEALRSIGNSKFHQPWTVAQSLVRTLLFPVVYFLSEMGIESDVNFSFSGWITYMVAPGHQFIFAVAILLGILLGIAEAQADEYAKLLRRAARQLKQYADWGLDPWSKKLFGTLINSI
ncbi:MAG: hypothetical protein H8D34_24945 [Chloroflexi bacterium]|nr:hypothetical protein [Chloroflexota bacterium]MBL7161644.1 hypothetical protein [Anaerolineales bacterium]